MSKNFDVIRYLILKLNKSGKILISDVLADTTYPKDILESHIQRLLDQGVLFMAASKSISFSERQKGVPSPGLDSYCLRADDEIAEFINNFHDPKRWKNFRRQSKQLGELTIERANELMKDYDKFMMNNRKWSWISGIIGYVAGGFSLYLAIKVFEFYSSLRSP